MKPKELILLCLILLGAAVLRLLFLNSVPGAIAGDELTYILNAKSVALTGTALKDNWTLLQALIFQYPHGLSQAELPYFLFYPSIMLFGFSLTATKILFVAVSVATVWAIYLLAAELFDKKTGIIAAALAAVNPWQIFIGRTSYDMVPAMLFFPLAIYALIKFKGNKIFLSVPLFFLAFYSYIGTKIAFIPIVAAVTIYAYLKVNKKYAKQYLIVNVVCILFVLFFATSFISKSGNNRSSELFTPFSPEVASLVDETRKNSMSQGVIAQLSENKLSVYAKVVSNKLVTVFSPDYLFVSTDNFVSLYSHGFFFSIDALFLILGLLFAFSAKRKAFILLGVLIVLSTLPQVFYKARANIFSPHLALFFTLLLIPIAYGIAQVISSKYKIVAMLVGILYFASITNFLNIYFNEFPLVGHFDFASREASNYAKLAAQKGYKVNLYVDSAEDSFNKYLFYSDSLNYETIDRVKQNYKKGEYTLGNVSFFPCGEIYRATGSATVNLYQSGVCGDFNDGDEKYFKIASLRDGGQIYRIYGDKLCSAYKLKGYPAGLNISDFSVENLSPQKFCETFITR